MPLPNIIRGLAMLASVAVVVVVAGCGGGSSDNQQVTTAVRSYLNGIAGHNGQESCNQLTSAAAKALLASANQQDPQLKAKSCADVLNTIDGLLSAADKKRLLTAKVVNVKVSGSTATASVQGGDRPAKLVKQNGHWLISGGVGS